MTCDMHVNNYVTLETKATATKTLNIISSWSVGRGKKKTPCDYKGKRVEDKGTQSQRIRMEDKVNRSRG